MSAPRIVGKNYTDAIRFARETLGLHPNTVRVVSSAGALAGYGFTLHLAPGWKKNPAYHSINSRLRFKRGIEIIDHSAEVQKESTRKVEDTPEPPEGWFNFGTHVDHDGPVEFSDETDETGMPKWERPAESSVEIPPERVEEIAQDVAATAERLDVTLGGEPWFNHDNGQAPEPEETDAETGTKEPGEDAEGAEEQPKRRRRRCKVCGILVEPDDVEAHAAQHEEE